jgi:hypothetical protein
VARRSASSSALALGNPVNKAIAAVSPPSAAIVPIFRFLIIAPPKHQSCSYPRQGRASLSPHDIARVATIKLCLFDSWCFRRSVAKLQHVHVCCCREKGIRSVFRGMLPPTQAISPSGK